MDREPTTGWPQWARRFAQVCGGVTTVLGLLLIAGWAVNAGIVRQIWPREDPNSLLIGVAAVCGGIALMLAGPGRRPRMRHRFGRGLALAMAVAAVAVGMGLTARVIASDGWSPMGDAHLNGGAGADRLLDGAPLAAVWMPPLAAICFALAGFAVFLIQMPRPRVQVAGQAMAVATMGVSAAVLIGLLYAVGGFGAVALGDAALGWLVPLLCLLLAVGVFTARPETGMMRALSAGPRMGRVLPIAIAAPVALGGAEVAAMQAGIVDMPTGTACVAAGNVLIFGALIGLTLAAASRVDGARADHGKSRDHDEWFLMALASIADGVIVTDSAGHVRFINAKAVELTGWPANAAFGRRIDEVFCVIDDPSRQAIPNLVLDAVRTREAIAPTSHALLITRDGREVPIDRCAAPIPYPMGRAGAAALANHMGAIDGWREFLDMLSTRDGVSGAVLIFRDVSERRAAEHAMAERASRFHRLANSMPQIVWTANAAGEFDYFNQRWAEFMGLAPGTVAAKAHRHQWMPRVHPDDVAATTRMWEAARTANAVYQIEHRLRGNDGQYRWFLSRGMPLTDDQGQAVRWFGTTTDIHEQKMAQAQLQVVSAELEARVAERAAVAERRAAQLRALAIELTQAEQHERRRIAQTLHDHLQQLLVAAKMRVDRLRAMGESDPSRALADEAESLLRESIDASRSLTMQLSPPVLHDAGLGPALEWLARSLSREHSLGVEISISPAVANLAIDADIREFLFQAVRELLFNVVKHAGTDRAIVTLDALPGGNRVEVGVRDEGRGCEAAKLFAREYSAGGFGLFNIQQRLEFLGGQLVVDTAPGRGCDVRMTTPIEPPKTSPIAETPRSSAASDAPSMPDARRRIMLVDDHRILREGLVELLRDEDDLEVVAEASNGEIAVDVVRRVQPDVVVMDVNLPTISGIEATRRIHGEFPQIRVVALSMADDAYTMAAMHEAGATAYVGKARPVHELLAAIRR